MSLKQHLSQIFQTDSPSVELEWVIERLHTKGYRVYDSELELNIVGVRRRPFAVDEFNDVLVVFWMAGGQWSYQKYQITTIPGLRFLKDKLGNPDGTAILEPGQYVDNYLIDIHHGSSTHQALCQDDSKLVPVFRDKKLDGVPNLDPDTIEGTNGIDIHRALQDGATSKVNGFSSGCQVFRDAAQFAAFMAIVRKSRDARNENLFTYTLIDADD